MEMTKAPGQLAPPQIILNLSIMNSYKIIDILINRDVDLQKCGTCFIEDNEKESAKRLFGEFHCYCSLFGCKNYVYYWASKDEGSPFGTPDALICLAGLHDGDRVYLYRCE